MNSFSQQQIPHWKKYQYFFQWGIWLSILNKAFRYPPEHFICWGIINYYRTKRYAKFLFYHLTNNLAEECILLLGYFFIHKAVLSAKIIGKAAQNIRLLARQINS